MITIPMIQAERRRLIQELTTNGYTLTSYESLGLTFDVSLAKELTSIAISGKFSPDAAKLTERIDKKKMTMVQDTRSLDLGRRMVAPAVEAIFVDNPVAREGWELYAMNCYAPGGELGVHQDSVEKTVLVITASGERRIDVYDPSETEETGFTVPQKSFLLAAGSVMILDAEADPGHAIQCIKGPSVSAVLDVPAVLRHHSL